MTKTNAVIFALVHQVRAITPPPLSHAAAPGFDNHRTRESCTHRLDHRRVGVLCLCLRFTCSATHDSGIL